eukprot:15351117-Ditylum_brightwellii.AAC.1
MSWALDKYILLNTRKRWRQESVEDQIVVLTSTVDDLKDDNLKLTKALSQEHPEKPKFNPRISFGRPTNTNFK